MGWKLNLYWTCLLPVLLVWMLLKGTTTKRPFHWDLNDLTETKPGLTASATFKCQCLCASCGIFYYLLAGHTVLGEWPKTKGKIVMDRKALNREDLCNSLSIPGRLPCLTSVSLSQHSLLSTSDRYPISYCPLLSWNTPLKLPSWCLSGLSYDSDHRSYKSCVYVFFKWYLKVSLLHHSIT